MSRIVTHRCRPYLLDLCCKAGGAAMGYYRAGFDVVGVDIEPQPNYPFTFHQADALTFLLDGIDGKTFDAVHVSPPCQGYSTISACRKGVQEKHPRLIEAFRQRLRASGLPYVIENVVGARSHMLNPITLCGNMFGLRVYRHRLFESNIVLQQPDHVPHVLRAASPGAIARVGEYWSPAGHFGGLESAKVAMGIDWPMTNTELANAIPPAYAEWVGLQLIQVLGQMRQAIRIQMCECGCGALAKTPVRAGRPGRFATEACKKRVYRALRADVPKLLEVKEILYDL